MEKLSEALIRKSRTIKKNNTLMDARNLSAVLANLVFLHDAVVASEQLLREASRATSLLEQSEFTLLLDDYYTSHLAEEENHVDWIKEDLKTFEIYPAFPNEHAVTLAGAQYYLMKHVHPVALLGYLVVMEGDPVPIEIVDALEALHGDCLFRFIRFHAVKDVGHRDDLFDIIDRAPSSLHEIIDRSLDITLRELVYASKSWCLGEQLVNLNHI